MTFFLASAWIWTKQRWIKRLTIVMLVTLLILLLSLGYTRYLSPIKGVLVQSFEPRRDAGEQYANAAKQPLPAGSEVEVLSISPDGNWLKVLTPNGDFGYVSQDAIRIIGP